MKELMGYISGMIAVDRVDTHGVFRMRPIERIFKITNCTSQAQLAKLLGLTQPAISLVCRKKSGEVPDHWLLILLRTERVNPDWIVTGEGPTHYAKPRTLKEGRGGRKDEFEKALRTVISDPQKKILRKLPSEWLVKELARRLRIVEHAFVEMKNGKTTQTAKELENEIAERAPGRTSRWSKKTHNNLT